MNNYGVQNEYDFVEHFNDKYYSDFDSNSKLFLNELFGDLSDDEKILCWKNKYMQKADIYIKYKNYIKGISLKCGNSNSVHHETIEEFRQYLEKLGIEYKTIEKYVSYHYGYMRDEKDRIDFTKSLSSEEYKRIYQSELDEFNDAINKTKIIIEMTDRFIIRGRNAEYDIDALICGKVDNYVWIMKYDIYDLILSNRCNEYTSPHIACMTIGPKKRNLNRNSKNSRERYVVCIRWNFIRENIIDFKKSKT
jgi:hypothetical protein